MKKNTIILMFGILVILIGIIILLESDKTPVNEVNNNETQNNENVVEEYTAKLEPNIIPNFKEGEKFLYKFIMQQDSFAIVENKIGSIQRFNKTDCLLIISNSTEYFNNRVEKSIAVKTCIDKNGNPLYVETNYNFSSLNYFVNEYEEGNNASSLITANSFIGFFYAPWMLALKKGLKFKGNLDVPTMSFVHSDEKNIPTKTTTYMDYDLTVTDIENAEGIDCFKVQIDVKLISEELKSEKEYTGQKMRIILWIDAKKRIVIKGAIYSKNLPIGEIKKIN